MSEQQGRLEARVHELEEALRHIAYESSHDQFCGVSADTPEPCDCHIRVARNALESSAHVSAVEP